MKTQSDLVLLTNLPAPYRVPVWNHLALVMSGGFEVRFIAPSDARRRSWTVPAAAMNFRWKFLSRKGGVYAAFAMLWFLLCRRPRAVICGGYNSLAAWVTFAWCKVARRRFVLWLEATTRDARPPSRPRTWLRRLIVGRADAIAASGTATVEYVRALGARDAQIFLAPFGGDYQSFARQAAAVDAAAEKRRHGFTSHLVLYSGRLVREKGVLVLLEAFRRVASELSDAGLLIVGDGPARAEMETHWDIRRVLFAGAQDYPLMPRFYALADVLVLPTFSDQWGYVVNEAFACGVPAIVSRVAGVCDDLIVPGETGLTVEPGDADELAAKMRLLLTAEGLRSQMSGNCLRAILPYSAEACAAGLVAAAENDRARSPLVTGRAGAQKEWDLELVAVRRLFHSQELS